MPVKRFLRRFISLSLAGFMTFILLASCGRNVDQTFINEALPTENCRVVQHEMGETCIPNNPQRVITLFIHTLANSLALGVRPIASTYITELKQALGDRRHTLTVSVANTSSEYGIWAYGEKHYSGMVLSDIGLQRPLAQQGDFFYIENISQEKLSDIDGDVLFFVSGERDDDKKTLEKLQQNPLWKQLKVVQENKVYFVGMHWHSSDIFAINAILDDLFKYLVNSP